MGFQNIQPQSTSSSSSFIQQSRSLSEQQAPLPQGLPSSQHVGLSQKQSIVQTQQMFSPQYRFPDYLSYAPPPPPPPVPHPPMQQQSFNFILANNQQQQFMQTPPASGHQTNPLMPGCPDDFGAVNVAGAPQHNMAHEQSH